MYRIILCIAAALLVSGGWLQAQARSADDDYSLCDKGSGDEAIAACSRLLAADPKNTSRRRPSMTS